MSDELDRLRVENAALRRRLEEAEAALASAVPGAAAGPAHACDERYRLLVESTSDMLFRVGLRRPLPLDLPEQAQVDWIFREAYMVAVNEAFALAYGYAGATDLAGLPLVDLVPRTPENEAMELALVRGGHRIVEARTEERDRLGGRKVMLNSIVGRIEDGHVLDYLGTARDITERVAAEEALRASEQRYRQMFEDNPLPMWVFDAQTLAFLAVNEAAVEHYGWSREEFLAMTIAQIRPPEDVPRLHEALGASAPQRLRRDGAWVHRRKGGDLIEVEITSHPLEFDGRAARLVLVNDVTERRRTEVRLRASESRLRQAVDLAGIATCIWNPSSRMLECDARLKSIWGLPPDAPVRADDLLAGVHPEDRAMLEERIGRALDPAGDGACEAEFRVLAADGTPRWVSAQGQASFAGGRLAGFVGSALDVTERRGAEADLGFLAELSAAFAPLASSQEIARLSAQALCRHFGATRVSLSDVSPAGDAVTVFAGEREAGLKDDRVTHPLAEYVDEQVVAALRAGEVVTVSDVTGDARIGERAQAYAQWGIASLALVPHVAEGRWKFMVALHKPQPYAWRADEVALLREVATRVYLRLERARTEEALAASEARLQLAMLAGQAATWDVDLASGRAVWSESHFTLLGLPPTPNREVSAQTWQALIVPEDLPAIREAWERAERTRELYRAEHRIRRIDNGAVLWVRAAGRFIYDEADDRAVRFVGVFFDVSAEKAAEAALRESEARFRSMANTTPALIWTADASGRISFHNQRWLDYTGIATADCPGEWPRLVLHPDDLAGGTRAWKDALETGADYEIEARIRRRDGDYRWFLVRATAIRDASERVAWYGSATDIQDRKQAEEALAAQRRLYASITDNASVALFIMDEHQQCVFMNPAAVALTGYTLDETRGRPLHDVLHHTRADGSHYPLEECPIDRALPQNDREQGEEVFVHKDGHFYDVAFTASPVRDAGGRPVGTIIEVQDITERKRGERALREADRRKDEFLAMLAHELRNPLAPIRNAVQLLRLLAPKDPALVGASDMIERQVSHLVRLVDDLLDVSRVSRGRIELQKAPLDLAMVVRQAVETSRPFIDARHHALSVALPERPLLVEGDFVRLAQVVCNLLHNAAKYTDEGGRIAVALDRVAEEAVIRVRDSGRGIDPSVLGNLFELFYQADRTLDRAEGGLGIGLSLVKSLVQMHRGRVEAHSTGRGRGSEFVVRLPVLAAETVAARRPAGAAAPRDGRRLRVLVVDDNLDSADSMALLLQMEGHEVLTAYDGRQAVEVALAERPDVVLLDIGLPKLDGHQACRAMREDGLTDALIVAMTGYGQAEDRRRSEEAGFDAHLVKPVDLEGLQSLLAARVRPVPRRH